MANLTAGSNIRRLDDQPVTLRQQMPDLPDLSRAGKGSKTGLATELDRLAAEAVKRSASETTIQLDVFAASPAGAGHGQSLVDIAALTKAKRRLDEARELMRQGKFQKALPMLQEILADQPGHVEASYLAAFCLFKLEKPMEALRALVPLARHTLDNQTATRAQSLHEQIRAEIFVSLVISKKIGEFAEALALLEELTHLDSEYVIWHHLLILAYLESGNPEKAMQALTRGLSQAASDKDRLEKLRLTVEGRVAARKMNEARQRYKAREYAAALTELGRLDETCRQTVLYRTFYGYLKQLSGGFLGFLQKNRRTPAEVVAAGSFAEVDALHFFLVGEDLARASDAVQHERLDQARQQYQAVLQWTPHFPFANFQYGYCIYQSASADLRNDSPTPLDEMIATMQRAKFHAEIGVRDPEISAAKDLLGAIDRILQLLDEARHRREEARPINKAIEEYVSIMESVKGNITSVTQYNTVRERMSALRATVRKLAATRDLSAEGRKAIGDLGDAVERSWKQLEEIDSDVRDSELVEQCVSVYQSKLEEVKNRGTIGSRSEALALRQFMRDLRSKTQSALGKVKRAEAKETLNRLLEAINDILSRMGG
jgi:tetratricopeptide (TPR) repeat protein